MFVCVPTVLGRHAKCLQLHNNGKDQREIPIPLPPIHLVLWHAHSFVRSFEMCQMATWQTSATDKATDTNPPSHPTNTSTQDTNTTLATLLHQPSLSQAVAAVLHTFRPRCIAGKKWCVCMFKLIYISRVLVLKKKREENT